MVTKKVVSKADLVIVDAQEVVTEGRNRRVKLTRQITSQVKQFEPFVIGVQLSEDIPDDANLVEVASRMSAAIDTLLAPDIAYIQDLDVDKRSAIQLMVVN